MTSKDFALILIDSIKSGSTFGKDLGDIALFAKNISQVGLLHPIAFKPEHELICGWRRIEAFSVGVPLT